MRSYAREGREERGEGGKGRRVGMEIVCGLVSVVIDLGQVLSNGTGEE
jgi:hypothetical protein